MAATIADDTYFAFGSNGTPTTEVDRSTSFNNLSMPREMAEVDVTAFGNSGNTTFIAGAKGGTISGDGFWDATINTHITGIFDGQDVVEWEYGPLGNTGGNPKFSGSAFVTSYEVTNPVNEANAFTITFRITTAVTTGTF